MLKNDEENDRYIEIWGIVFSQYNAVDGVDRKDYKELPKKNIDTGAGLERIACVLQETPTNFETDLFWPIIEATEKICHKPYVNENLMAYRVIADHIRACTFALADGASFSNEGRGYVLRRLLRRAMRYGRKLGIVEPFLYHLVPVVVENFDNFYPYLQHEQNRVIKLIKSEEEKFIRTLNSGETMLRKMLDGINELSGEDAFKLYDTYGFPIDLTQEIAEENGIKVDTERFEQLLDEQKQRARDARSAAESMAVQSADLLNCQVASTFIYDELSPLKAKVVALFVDGKKVNQIDDNGDIIFDKTNFYAESGGQSADRGLIISETVEAEVSDVRKAPNHQHLHHVEVHSGSIKIGDELTLAIDVNARRLTMRNHSATHLLDAVLNEVLGADVHQAGSFVGPEYLRFDFNYNEAVGVDKLLLIEDKVNHLIADALEQKTLVLPIDEAKKLGAKSLFDEKYGATVRVVCFGDASKEFCGGTHVRNTADIGMFLIYSEKSVAAGTRRIEARTSLGAYDLARERTLLLNETAHELKSSNHQGILVAIDGLKKERDIIKAENAQLKDRLAQNVVHILEEKFVVLNSTHILVSAMKNATRNDLLKIIDGLKSYFDDMIILLLGDDGTDRYPLVAYVSPTLNKQGVKAGDLIRQAAQLLGGSGGGRPDIASGAARDLTHKDQLMPLVKGLIK